jgi:hypothetical protein
VFLDAGSGLEGTRGDGDAFSLGCQGDRSAGDQDATVRGEDRFRCAVGVLQAVQLSNRLALIDFIAQFDQRFENSARR